MPSLRPRAYSASSVAPRATSNTPASSAALGRLQVTATSPAPDSTTASAVLADIGVELPNRKMTVARANHATRTVTPIAAHSSPAAAVMASSTGPDLDDASAR
jgi:hypothetical protein